MTVPLFPSTSVMQRQAGASARRSPRESLLGLVCDAVGRALPGASVSLVRVAEPRDGFAAVHRATGVEPPRATTRADRSGRFRFEDLPHGRFTMVARVPGRAAVEASIVVRGTTRVTLYTQRGHRVSGTLTGAVRAGVEVVALPDAVARVPALLERVRTDAAGRFAFPHLRRGGWRLLAIPDGHCASLVARVGVPFDRSVELELPAGDTLRGRVLDARGRPTDDVEIAVALDRGFDGDLDLGGSALVHTDAAGWFEVAGVPAWRSSWCRVRAPGLSPLRVRLPPPSDGAAPDIVLPDLLLPDAYETDEYGAAECRGADGRRIRRADDRVPAAGAVGGSRAG